MGSLNMARKNILKGLMEAPTQAPAPEMAQPDHGQPRSSRGAIGAVSRSIADLKARAVVELDPLLIEGGGMQDRLESSSADDNQLKNSIAEYGQQVPVLVRPHPEQDGHYQIVYGRRRVLALRDLGQPVKALIRDLDDRELVLAQGQENTARRDLSFIEKVNFAQQMATAGYDRKVICDALSVDKTLISRMLSIAERIPAEVIHAIGAAPSVGRDRWIALAERMVETEADPETLQTVAMFGDADGSDQRFALVWDHLNKPAAPEPASPRPAPKEKAEPQKIRAANGLAFAESRMDRNFMTLKLRLAQTSGFEEWLVDALPRLLEDWRQDHPLARDTET